MAAAGTGSAVIKRVAALNRSGALSKPLQYSLVKSELTGVSEELALRILNQLEVEAAKVADPVEYVKDSVGRLAASEAAPQSERKRKAGAEDELPPGQGDSLIAKRIRVLNGSGKLSRPISLGPVTSALNSLDVREAMKILKGLEEGAQDVADPTGYIRAAVCDAGGEVPEGALEEEDEQDEDPAKGMAVGLTGRVKQELGRGFYGAKLEDLTDAEKIERRIGWLNRNSELTKPISVNEVLPALDCIGFRQSMRVLRRLEESAATVPDPDEYIKDLVARAGWIWAKPDVIDDDEKVAKRISWLNQFGGLQQPIDYAQVADALDGLKVPHAMVLLRELEVQSHKVQDPTAFIKRAVGSAGVDEVQVPMVNEDSAIAQRISLLNQAGGLAAPIEYKEVGHDLGRIGDEDALQLLQEVANKGASVKDPTGFIKFKLKAKLASLGNSLDEPASDDTKILKRIEWLNDYGGLVRDIEYNRVAVALENAGVDHAMTILKELEDNRQNVREPNTFILNAVKASWKRSAAGAQPPIKAPSPEVQEAPPPTAPDSGATILKALSGFISFLSKNPKVKKAVNFGELAASLDALGPKRALQILHQMQTTGLGLDDPLTYIRAASQRKLLTGVKKESEEDGEDDVAKITKRLKWLNQFAGLATKIRINDVVGALYCLGVPPTMEILRDLQEQGKRVADPTWYIKAAVQRANGIRVAPPPPSSQEGAGEKGQEDDAFDGEEQGNEEQEEDGEEEPGAMMEFEVPEGDGDGEEEAGAEGEPPADGELAEATGDAYWEPGAAAEDEGEAGADAGGAGPGDDQAADMEAETPDAQAAWRAQVMAGATSPAGQKPKPVRKAAAKPHSGHMRVVGSISGATGKLVPTRPNYPDATQQKPLMVKSEAVEEGAGDEAEQQEEPEAPEPTAKPPGRKASSLPVTPQEKMVQVRELALKNGLDLDPACLKALARLPFYKSQDLIADVLLGGRNRQGVHNPSKYLMVGCQKMTSGLGVEQGLAMELAVSLGVVLNNDALDELACIPRKESQSIIRELARNPEARRDPQGFIEAEVLKCRAHIDARPWPPAG